ncbi:MAG: DUF4352 domain-containing protein [Chloroflexota bacterium]|nr:DUF4352 domain-containing protein [Chloroflexota bacterium]
MSFSREFRYRNMGASPDQERGGRRIPPGYFVIGAVALIVALCCCCAGAAVLVLNRDKLPAVGGPAPTPTLDKNAPVPLGTKAVADNGLELTVLNLQRPLQVQGSVKLPSDQQFILVSLRVHNTKKTGAPISVNAADFKVMGDGGLTYDANPKTVTTPAQLTQKDVASNATVDVDLIYQIAVNDTGLRLYWKVGASTRVFLLESQK